MLLLWSRCGKVVILNVLTHVSPQDGRGITIANEVYDAIKGTGLSDTLKVVGTDGTASMTGNKAGFIRCLEEKPGRPLQWVVSPFFCTAMSCL